MSSIAQVVPQLLGRQSLVLPVGGNDSIGAILAFHGRYIVVHVKHTGEAMQSSRQTLAFVREALQCGVS
jgi:hypothetical protein